MIRLILLLEIIFNHDRRIVFASEIITTLFKEDIIYKDRVKNNYICEFKETSLVQCAAHCLTTYQCIAFHMHETTGACRLLSAHIGNISSTEMNNGWNYYRGVICPAALVYGSDIPHKTDVGVQFQPAVTVSYGCDVGFQPEGETGMTTCTSQGTWSTPTLRCSNCSSYSSSYQIRPNRYLDPLTVLEWSPTFGSYDMLPTDCTLYCTEYTEFLCIVAYFKKVEPGTYGECIILPVRYEEKPGLYGQHYNISNTEWDEYVRICA